jgi:predicted RNase H-like HicB family nuclease
MEKYLVIIEKAENNYAAFSPDAWGVLLQEKP